jgi:hypothetical protein
MKNGASAHRLARKIIARRSWTRRATFFRHRFVSHVTHRTRPVEQHPTKPAAAATLCGQATSRNDSRAARGSFAQDTPHGFPAGRFRATESVPARATFSRVSLRARGSALGRAGFQPARAREAARTASLNLHHCCGVLVGSIPVVVENWRFADVYCPHGLWARPARVLAFDLK